VTVPPRVSALWHLAFLPADTSPLTSEGEPSHRSATSTLLKSSEARNDHGGGPSSSEGKLNLATDQGSDWHQLEPRARPGGRFRFESLFFCTNVPQDGPHTCFDSEVQIGAGHAEGSSCTGSSAALSKSFGYQDESAWELFVKWRNVELDFTGKSLTHSHAHWHTRTLTCTHAHARAHTQACTVSLHTHTHTNCAGAGGFLVFKFSPEYRADDVGNMQLARRSDLEVLERVMVLNQETQKELSSGHAPVDNFEACA
jgi:hypothetical protein